MIKNLEDAKQQLAEYFGNLEEWREASESQRDDAISELADSNVDVYNADLLEWAKSNYSTIEEVQDEMGIAKDSEGRADFIKQIMLGQYKANEELLREAAEELTKD